MKEFPSDRDANCNSCPRQLLVLFVALASIKKTTTAPFDSFQTTANIVIS